MFKVEAVPDDIWERFSMSNFLASNLHISKVWVASLVWATADLTKNHYRDRIMALEHRWNKCISLKGDYVEK